jgi:hypothetical protein
LATLRAELLTVLDMWETGTDKLALFEALIRKDADKPH